MKRAFLLTFIIALTGINTPAADPQELVDLRKKYLEALGGIREPIKAKYLNALQELLTEHTRDGNLEQALTVRAAIKALENEKSGDLPGGGIGDPGASPPGSGTITLRAADATLEGALKLDRGRITNWIRPNCRARWHDRSVPAGKYNVFLICEKNYYARGGRVEVRDFTYSFDVQIPRRAEQVEAGTIDIRGGISMQITAKTTSKSDIMYLREVRLVPTN